MYSHSARRWRTWVGVFALLLLSCCWTTGVRADESVVRPVPNLDLSTFRTIPIQESGRYKPIDTYARESMELVTGHENFEDPVSKATWDPDELMLSLMTHPDYWRQQPIVQVRNEWLKKQLGLSLTAKFFTPEELGKNAQLEKLFQDVDAKARREEKLNDNEKAIRTVEDQLSTLIGITSGHTITIIPDPNDKTARWISVGELADGTASLGSYTKEDLAPSMNAFQAMLVAYNGGDVKAVEEQSLALSAALAKLPKTAGIYPDANKMAVEVQYNSLHPFRWSWILFTTAFVVLLMFSGSKSKLSYWAGMSVYAAALLMTVYGFYLRCTIAGRPPVTNMYESVIWVSFGATFFAFIFEMIYKVRRFAIAASAVGTIGLVLADNLPNVLVSSIGPLAPVLRSNYWLTIHVLTITLSYAAFLLTWGLGHQALWNYLRNPHRKDIIAPLARYIYKAMQVGVLLVAAGTILGGVWANYSWGRFWGWDPKEVWALIVLLSYLTILHGRYAGWLKDFGTVVASVCCFLSVLMAWYGVNFILGVGLHSYGFGTGGSQYVMSFAGADLAFVGFVAWRYKNWLANRGDSGPAMDQPSTGDSPVGDEKALAGV